MAALCSVVPSAASRIRRDGDREERWRSSCCHLWMPRKSLCLQAKVLSWCQRAPSPQQDPAPVSGGGCWQREQWQGSFHPWLGLILEVFSNLRVYVVNSSAAQACVRALASRHPSSTLTIIVPPQLGLAPSKTSPHCLCFPLRAQVSVKLQHGRDAPAGRDVAEIFKKRREAAGSR